MYGEQPIFHPYIIIISLYMCRRISRIKLNNVYVIMVNDDDMMIIVVPCCCVIILFDD